MVAPPEWNRELARLVSSTKSAPLSVMVTGPKSSGKSTFGKLLANRFITEVASSTRASKLGRVAVLDLDPGQPEYCLPGQIALVCLEAPVLGPSFCHNAFGSGFKVLRSHTLASVTPSSDPELYVEAAEDLIIHYRNRLASCPVIINTPGWIQGTGLDLLGSLIGAMRPSEVVYMSTTGPSEAVEYLEAACTTLSFTMLPSQPAQYGARTAAQLRAMHAMAYFHAVPDTLQPHVKPQWNPKPLTTDPPWLVSYGGPVQDRGIYGIMCYDYQAPLDLLSDTINGSVLAIVEVESPLAFRHTKDTALDMAETSASQAMDENMAIDTSDDGPNSLMQRLEQEEERLIRTTPEGLPIIGSLAGTTLDPRYSQTIGLALVRGVDAKNNTIHLSTPIGVEMIQDIVSRGNHVVLVSGKFDSPSWAYTEDLYYQDTVKDEEVTGQDDAMDIESDGGQNWTGRESAAPGGFGSTPWIQVLHGDQKRSVGSKVWRVRRDLGRPAN